jgi:plasmid stability protein
MSDEVNGASKNAEVPAMYVRNVPEKLLRLVRSQAALRGQSMRDYVLEAVRAQLVSDGIDVPDEDEGDG